MVGSDIDMTDEWAAYLAWKEGAAFLEAAAQAKKDSIMKRYQDSKVEAKTDELRQGAKTDDALAATQAHIYKRFADLGLHVDTRFADLGAKIDLAYDLSKTINAEMSGLVTKLSNFNEDHKDDRLAIIIAVAISTFVMLLALYYFRAT